MKTLLVLLAVVVILWSAVAFSALFVSSRLSREEEGGDDG